MQQCCAVFATVETNAYFFHPVLERIKQTENLFFGWSAVTGVFKRQILFPQIVCYFLHCTKGRTFTRGQLRAHLYFWKHSSTVRMAFATFCLKMASGWFSARPYTCSIAVPIGFISYSTTESESATICAVYCRNEHGGHVGGKMYELFILCVFSPFGRFEWRKSYAASTDALSWDSIVIRTL